MGFRLIKKNYENGRVIVENTTDTKTINVDFGSAGNINVIVNDNNKNKFTKVTYPVPSDENVHNANSNLDTLPVAIELSNSSSVYPNKYVCVSFDHTSGACEILVKDSYGAKEGKYEDLNSKAGQKILAEANKVYHQSAEHIMSLSREEFVSAHRWTKAYVKTAHDRFVEHVDTMAKTKDARERVQGSRGAQSGYQDPNLLLATGATAKQLKNNEKGRGAYETVPAENTTRVVEKAILKRNKQNSN